MNTIAIRSLAWVNHHGIVASLFLVPLITLVLFRTYADYKRWIIFGRTNATRWAIGWFANVGFRVSSGKGNPGGYANAWGYIFFGTLVFLYRLAGMKQLETKILRANSDKRSFIDTERLPVRDGNRPLMCPW